MKPNLTNLLVVFLILLTINSASATEPLVPVKTGTPPVIDGVIDDSAWTNALQVRNFKTFYPDFSKDATDPTIVYVTYDSENLYFAFKCIESEPDKIKSSITSRDNIRSEDFVCINLDTFNDQQSLHTFYVNPVGIQMDARYANGEEDFNVDMVWYSAGRHDSDGYSVEIRVPFKSIRYSNSSTVDMGIFLERRVSRLSEHSSFPAMNPSMGYNFLTQLQTIKFSGIRKYTLFELLPAATFGKNEISEEGELVPGDEISDISLTAKYGITPELILDGTLNPDFSQVEADAGQVDINLRFALYFPEKRPFFLEGQEYFNFGASGHHDPLRSVVHTRMIRDPEAGLKLSGKFGQNNTIAAIYAADKLPTDEITSDSDDQAHFSVVRYKRSLWQDSFLGGFYTGRESGKLYNRVAGMDGMLRLGEGQKIEFHSFLSNTDNQDETKDGHAATVKFSHNTRRIVFTATALDIAKDFRTETGYLTRNGISLYKLYTEPKFYPDTKVLRRINLSILGEGTRDKYYDLWEYYTFIAASFTFIKSSNIRIGLNSGEEIFEGARFDVSEAEISGSSQITNRLSVNAYYNRGGKIFYSDDPYQGYGNYLSGGVTYQPTENFRTQLNVTYSDFYRDSDSEKIYDYKIYRSRNTYQLNKYLFFRGIVEYNSFYEELLTDFLASFTYIPGTVLHAGYGSLFEKTRWVNNQYEDSNKFLQTRRGFFLKASYLWRL